MKNDKTKPMAIVLLDGAGAPLLDSDGNQDSREYLVSYMGRCGFRVHGLGRTLWLGDEGKTWKRAEGCK